MSSDMDKFNDGLKRAFLMEEEMFSDIYDILQDCDIPDGVSTADASTIMALINGIKADTQRHRAFVIKVADDYGVDLSNQ